MLGVHERHLAAHLLGRGQDVQRQRGLAGGLRAVDLNDSAAGDAADAQRRIQRQRACGNRVHLHLRLVAQAHHRALSIVLLNL